MQALSLHKVMNEIAAHPDMVPAAMAVEVRTEAEGASHHFDIAEVTPFLGSDPLILDLLKDYLNAKADYQSALLGHGKDSPFADIAGDHVDSAWCMLQSRLFELKQDRAIAARAELLEKMEKKTFEAQQEHRFNVARREREEAYVRSVQKHEKAGREERWDNLWLVILYLISTRDPLRLFGNVFAGPPEIRTAMQ